MGQLPLAVTHLPSSTSFYLACLQPLGYRYVARHDDCVGFGISKGQAADFWLIQGNDSYPAGTAHATFPATTREEVGQFVKYALRAGGRVCGNPSLAAQPSGGCSASIIDIDGNTVEAVYNVDVPTNRRPSPVVKKHSRSTEWRRQSRDVSSSQVPQAQSQSQPQSQRNSFGPSGKTVLGTLVGVAAGAMVAYKMYNRSSGKQQPEEDERVPRAMPASRSIEDYAPPPPRYEAIQAPPQRMMAIEDTRAWDDRGSTVSGSRVHTVVSTQDQKAASVASAMEHLENSTAAWSIEDRSSNRVDAGMGADNRSVAPSRASTWNPAKPPSTFISDFDARTVALNSYGRHDDGGRHRRSRSSGPSSRVSRAPSAHATDRVRRSATQREPNEDATVVGTSSKAKSILKSTFGSQFRHGLDHGETHGDDSHAPWRRARTDQSGRRAATDPARTTSSGEETYHLVSYPVNVAPGKPAAAAPNARVYVDQDAYDSEATATNPWADARSPAEQEQQYTPRAHRPKFRVRRSTSAAARSRSQRSRFDEEVRPDDSATSRKPVYSATFVARLWQPRYRLYAARLEVDSTTAMSEQARRDGLPATQPPGATCRITLGGRTIAPHWLHAGTAIRELMVVQTRRQILRRE
ncbi:hypothetical protein KEM52_005946 [Ascosphaera acerosa]|nr:hypothetical protein KEM52_005946 [Ascosphaera acerosa]